MVVRIRGPSAPDSKTITIVLNLQHVDSNLSAYIAELPLDPAYFNGAAGARDDVGGHLIRVDNRIKHLVHRLQNPFLLSSWVCLGLGGYSPYFSRVLSPRVYACGWTC
jgi:hypothetical protein